MEPFPLTAPGALTTVEPRQPDGGLAERDGAAARRAREEASMSTAAAIARWVQRLRFDDLPADVVQVGRRAFLDTLGVILGACASP